MRLEGGPWRGRVRVCVCVCVCVCECIASISFDALVAA